MDTSSHKQSVAMSALAWEQSESCFWNRLKAWAAHALLMSVASPEASPPSLLGLGQPIELLWMLLLASMYCGCQSLPETRMLHCSLQIPVCSYGLALRPQLLNPTGTAHLPREYRAIVLKLKLQLIAVLRLPDWLFTRFCHWVYLIVLEVQMH